MRLRSFGPAWREAELDREIARLAAEYRRPADVEGGTARRTPAQHRPAAHRHWPPASARH
jgi:hypothetical protein